MLKLTEAQKQGLIKACSGKSHYVANCRKGPYIHKVVARRLRDAGLICFKSIDVALVEVTPAGWQIYEKLKEKENNATACQ